jgi:uncharacterized protein (DUF983 family)
MAKISKLQAILKAKCPRCRQGDIFKGPTYSLKGQVTNETCSHCGFRFEIEPGYFYAAMYVSYGLNVAEIVNTGILTFYFTQSESPWLYIAVIMGVILILSPFNYRYSRVILLHWLTPGVKYNPYYDKDDKDINL